MSSDRIKPTIIVRRYHLRKAWRLPSEWSCHGIAQSCRLRHSLVIIVGYFNQLIQQFVVRACFAINTGWGNRADQVNIIILDAMKIFTTFHLSIFARYTSSSSVKLHGDNAFTLRFLLFILSPATAIPWHDSSLRMA
jgi:hypothetical protein